MYENELKTPTELLALFPSCGYNVREIGYLLMLGLVDGVKVRDGCRISITSFETLLEYKKVFGRQKYQLGEQKKPAV